MRVNNENAVSYYVIQRTVDNKTDYLSNFDFFNQTNRTLTFDPVFSKAVPFTRLEVENFLSRLASAYFPETIVHGGNLDIAIIELKKSAKCISINEFGKQKSN